jgi:hypothetical protein
MSLDCQMVGVKPTKSIRNMGILLKKNISLFFDTSDSTIKKKTLGPSTVFHRIMADSAKRHSPLPIRARLLPLP